MTAALHVLALACLASVAPVALLSSPWQGVHLLGLGVVLEAVWRLAERRG